MISLYIIIFPVPGLLNSISNNIKLKTISLQFYMISDLGFRPLYPLKRRLEFPFFPLNELPVSEDYESSDVSLEECKVRDIAVFTAAFLVTRCALATAQPNMTMMKLLG